MGSLNEFFDYKNQFMKDLCCDKPVVTMVTDDEKSDVPNHTLAYSQVFPFEYVPDTVDNGQTFICFDVDIANVLNRTYYIPVLYVWVFTHKSKLRLPEGGVRIDELSSRINDLLNGSRFYGLGELELKRVDRFSPITGYQGRVLTYQAVDFNRLHSHSATKIPSNRRSRNL